MSNNLTVENQRQCNLRVQPRCEMWVEPFLHFRNPGRNSHGQKRIAFGAVKWNRRNGFADRRKHRMVDFAELQHLLGLKPEPDQPVIVLMCGIAGSGKTTFSKNIAETLGYTRLSIDEEVWSVNGRYGIRLSRRTVQRAFKRGAPKAAPEDSRVYSRETACGGGLQLLEEVGTGSLQAAC